MLDREVIKKLLSYNRKAEKLFNTKFYSQLPKLANSWKMGMANPNDDISFTADEFDEDQLGNFLLQWRQFYQTGDKTLYALSYKKYYASKNLISKVDALNLKDQINQWNKYKKTRPIMSKSDVSYTKEGLLECILYYEYAHFESKHEELYKKINPEAISWLKPLNRFLFFDMLWQYSKVIDHVHRLNKKIIYQL